MKEMMVPAKTEILLVGSEDKVISWERLEIGRQFTSSNYDEHIIEGGNHAQFASYQIDPAAHAVHTCLERDEITDAFLGGNSPNL